MRATSHNGRFGSAKHNGRNFDLNKAKHIDEGKTEDNFYWTWNKQGQHGGQGFEDCERQYYEQMFGTALVDQNERHIEARHEERIKTMDDWLKGRNTRPEECIYQIGDMHAKIDPKRFRKAAGELLNWLNDWSDRNGHPYQVLDVAGHMDETSFHLQARRVWQYQDADGVWHIGQNKALEAAGVPLPEPGKPVGPKNNRKITFDRMVRGKWIEICEKYGYQIERTPNDQHTEHMGKEALAELNEKKAELDELIQEAQATLQEAEKDRASARAFKEQAQRVKGISDDVEAKGKAVKWGLPTLPGSK